MEYLVTMTTHVPHGTPDQAVDDAQLYEARVRAIQGDWRARLGRVRSGSALELLIEALPGAVVLTAQSAASLIGRHCAVGSLGGFRL